MIIFKLLLSFVALPLLFLIQINTELPTPEDPFNSDDIEHQIYNKDGELLYKLED